MGTKTKAFGTGKKESHDSTGYYQRRLYSEIDQFVVEQKPSGPIHEWTQAEAVELLNQVWCADSRDLSFIPANSVALVITSPPYGVGKDYDEDLTLLEWCKLMHDIFEQCYRVLEPGGRLVVNIANTGRSPYIPLTHYLHDILLGLGYLERGEVIWHKGLGGQASSCAWGSFASASNPTLRDLHEYCIVVCKESFGRQRVGTSTITSEEFVRDTKSVWEMRTESAKRVGHPAPFPVELPRRFINLYTFVGDVILDPFMGSGSSCLAAIETGRNFIGVEKDMAYCELAERRIDVARLTK